MKRLIVLMIIFLNVNLFAKEPVFILRRDSVLRDFSLNEKIFSKGDRFYCYTDDIGEHGLGVPISDPLRVDIFLSDSNGKGYVGNINDVYLEDNNLKIDTDIKNSYWIPSYYYELLESQNVKSDLLKYESHWRSFKNQSIEPYRPWFDYISVQKYYFDDFYFVCFDENGYYVDVDFLAYLEEVSDTKIVYDVQKMYATGSPYKEMADIAHPDFIPLYEKEKPI